ncbi:DUF2800 domain-containing protein [bacterium]|nr:DUF2800 domain-containing protein [bacterium]
MEMKHLTIGGSTAARTLACPGWVKKSENIPRRPAGPAAREGSMHHEIMELCQKTNTKPEDHLGFVYEEDGHSITFDEDHLDLSNIAFNATNALLDELDIDEMIVEPFVQIIPDVAGGSIDVLGLSADGKTLLVLDYKFGQVKVSPEENAQMLFYALAAREDALTRDMLERVETLNLTIIQPKHKGTVFSWTTPVGSLHDYANNLQFAMTLVENGHDKGNPGAHCKYCPAEPYCVEKRQQVHMASTLGARSHNELMEAAALVTQVEDWVKDVKEELFLQLSRGVAIDGWKIVEKRATRKWADEGDAVMALTKKKIAKKHMYKTSFLTAPQMEKVLKKLKVNFDLDDFIEKKSSGNTLAPEDDSREAVIVTDTVGHLATIMEQEK